MTPMAQVVHVLRKDLREHRVRTMLFVAVVAVALSRALGFAMPVDPTLIALVTFLVGMAIVGAPVDADPPTDPRSFWATRPVAPAAMLGAKLAFMALLTLIAALAQAVAVASFDLPLATAAHYVARPSLIFASTLLAVLVVVASTNDVRARLLLVLAVVVAIPAGGQLLVSNGGPPGWLQPTASIAGPMVMVATLLHFYRSRPSGWIPPALALVVLLFAALALLRRPGPVEVPAYPASVQRAELIMSVPPESPTVRDGKVRVRMSAVQPAPGWQYNLRSPTLVVTLASGREISLAGDANFMNLGGDSGPLPLPRGVTAMRDPGEPIGWREVGLPVRPQDRDAEGQAIMQVTLTGNMLVTVMRVVDTIPVRVGATHAREGIRSVVDSLTIAGGRPVVVLRAEGLLKPDDGSRVFPFTSYFGRAYSLLGPDGERVPLNQVSTQASSGGLVLPTGAFGQAEVRLEPRDAAPGAALTFRDSTWVSGAKLLAQEPRPQGSYPVALTWRRGG